MRTSSVSPPPSRGKSFLTAENLEITILYILMFAGGLWHILNVLQNAMRLLSAPLVIMVALWIAFRYDQVLRQHRTADEQPTPTARFHWWNVVVGVSCYVIEFIGVKTGVIFGAYTYTDVWIPAFRGVPIAIGFAWLGMLLSSFGLVQQLLSASRPLWLRALVLAVLMTIFDIFMEPVAVKLSYWQWLDSTGHYFFVAPLQNYCLWFLISYTLGFGAMYMGLFAKPMPRVALHAYWAQLLYFSMVALGKP
jgi:putative membrane protein